MRPTPPRSDQNFTTFIHRGLMYFKTRYLLCYIMAPTKHAKSSTTEHYIEDHKEGKPVAVNAGLNLDQVEITDIDWKNQSLPAELSKLIDKQDE